MTKIQIIATLGSLIFLGLILYHVKRGRLKEAYALLWVTSGVLMILISVWVGLLEIIAELLGIYTPVAALFLFMLISILLILFQYSIVISAQAEKIKRLTQQCALQEERLSRQELEKQRNK